MLMVSDHAPVFPGRPLLTLLERSRMGTISDIARLAGDDRSAIHFLPRGDRKPGLRNGTTPSLLRTRESQDMWHPPAQQVLPRPRPCHQPSAIRDSFHTRSTYSRPDSSSSTSISRSPSSSRIQIVQHSQS